MALTPAGRFSTEAASLKMNFQTSNIKHHFPNTGLKAYLVEQKAPQIVQLLPDLSL
jgi:hypothetical protein